jgi:enoyl-CoA hydratase/carnithine racemase
MLATACDVRVMVKENARIGLNEISFGSSLFAGSLELLRFWLGDRRAQEVAYGGALYAAEQALGFGLIDAAVPEEALLGEARGRLEQLAGRSPDAFRSIKRLLRRPVEEEMKRTEDASIRDFVEIWYSKETRAELEKIKIRS